MSAAVMSAHGGSAAVMQPAYATPTIVQAAPATTFVQAAGPTTAYASMPTSTIVQAAPPTTVVQAAPPTTVVQAAAPTVVHAAAPALLHHPGVAPAPPADIMAGTATPSDVNNQKAVFLSSIDQQQKAAEALLLQQHQAQLENLDKSIEHAKTQYAIQKDQEAEAQRAQMEVQFRAQMHQLADTARSQKHGLEVQAAQLTAEYENVAATHKLNQERHAAETRHYNAHVQLQGEMAKLHQQAAALGR